MADIIPRNLHSNILYLQALLVIAILSLIHKADCLECFSCVGEESLAACTTTTQCKQDEHCHTRKYYKDGKDLFSMDCRPIAECRLQEDSPGSRGIEDSSSFELDLWTGCCADEQCNKNFDDHGNYMAPGTVLECYKCQRVNDPGDCTTFTNCNPREHCHTRKYYDGGEIFYDLDCRPIQECGLQEMLGASGRRRKIAKIEIDLWTSCCKQEHCNKDFDTHGNYIGHTLECYKCTGVANIEDCTNKQLCNVGEHCHVRHYYKDNDELFDMDCRSVKVCAQQEVDVGRRDVDVEKRGLDIELWTSCCNKDDCNGNFDRNGNYIGEGLACYSCKGVDDPADCTTKHICQPGQVCITNEVVASQGRSVYNLGCVVKPICLKMGYYLPYGKRHSKRFGLCRGCCEDKSLCNNQFCSRKTGLTGIKPIGASVAPVTFSDSPIATTTTETPTTTADKFASHSLKISATSETPAAGNNIEVSCSLDPPLSVSLSFTLHFENLVGVRHLAFTQKGRQLVYYLNNISSDDTGVYICEALWEAERITWKATATVVVL